LLGVLIKQTDRIDKNHCSITLQELHHFQAPVNHQSHVCQRTQDLKKVVSMKPTLIVPGVVLWTMMEPN
jgi:hypothetical protein